MLLGYQGRVAVITGAANGLGKALAKQLACLKCGLALVDIDASSLANTGQELAGSGVLTTCHVADVSSLPDLQRVAHEIRNTHGTVHLLINNAGVSASASFENTSAMDFERLMQVNFFGLVQ